MKKGHNILIIFFTILSIPILFIVITNNELKGTWIGEYSIHPEPELFLPNERILNFKNVSYSEKAPKHELSIVREGYFSNYFNWIKSKYNTFEIMKIEKDSLVIINLNDKSNFRTFRKLPDSLKNEQKIKLVGKKFLLENEKGLDTIQFKTDTNFYSSSIKSNFNWQQVNHSGFQILFMEVYLPFIIVSQNENSIKLKRLEKPNDNYILTELK
ncbi:hypothetical protein V6246_18060 [Algibacter sp. TI.3.09]|uniref:hypothetical protein n=1 Tax=Algibacter sp. TI.3.09 TaxID=3121298 RepID=UPI00311E31BE